MLTYKQKFNEICKEGSHSVTDIAELTGYKLDMLEKIIEKGKGAYYSNRVSVRPRIKSATEWGMLGCISLSWAEGCSN